ncbi:MAG: hypothetical protein ACR2MD_10495 [Aridibacter sp.]
MKNIELKFAKCLKLAVLTIVMLGAGAFTTNVRAQTARVFEIQIPFDFVIKDKTYDAGTYHIGRLNEANPDTLVLKNADSKKSLILHTQRLNSGDSINFSKLTFSRYGKTYFLDSIRTSGENYESRLPFVKSDRQRRSSVQLAEFVSINGK